MFTRWVTTVYSIVKSLIFKTWAGFLSVHLDAAYCMYKCLTFHWQMNAITMKLVDIFQNLGRICFCTLRWYILHVQMVNFWLTNECNHYEVCWCQQKLAIRTISLSSLKMISVLELLIYTSFVVCPGIFEGITNLILPFPPTHNINVKDLARPRARLFLDTDLNFCFFVCVWIFDIHLYNVFEGDRNMSKLSGYKTCTPEHFMNTLGCLSQPTIWIPFSSCSFRTATIWVFRQFSSQLHPYV